jgi:hypothetical protein
MRFPGLRNGLRLAGHAMGAKNKKGGSKSQFLADPPHRFSLECAI